MMGRRCSGWLGGCGQACGRQCSRGEADTDSRVPKMRRGGLEGVEGEEAHEAALRHGVQDLEQSRGRSHSQLRGSPKVVGLLLSHRAMGGGGRSLPLPRSCGRLPLLGRWERRGGKEAQRQRN